MFSTKNWFLSGKRTPFRREKVLGRRNLPVEKRGYSKYGCQFRRDLNEKKKETHS